MISASRRRRAVLQRHERLRPLAPALVGDRHDGALEHRGVRADRLLDLDRGDVLAAGDDHVLAAVAQLDGAVGVPHREVAGVEPAAPERRLGGLRVVEVARHDVVAAHHDLAHACAPSRGTSRISSSTTRTGSAVV